MRVKIKSNFAEGAALARGASEAKAEIIAKQEKENSAINYLKGSAGVADKRDDKIAIATPPEISERKIKNIVEAMQNPIDANRITNAVSEGLIGQVSGSEMRDADYEANEIRQKELEYVPDTKDLKKNVLTHLYREYNFKGYIPPNKKTPLLGDANDKEGIIEYRRLLRLEGRDDNPFSILHQIRPGHFTADNIRRLDQVADTTQRTILMSHDEARQRDADYRRQQRMPGIRDPRASGIIPSNFAFPNMQAPSYAPSAAIYASAGAGQPPYPLLPPGVSFLPASPASPDSTSAETSYSPQSVASTSSGITQGTTLTREQLLKELDEEKAEEAEESKKSEPLPPKSTIIYKVPRITETGSLKSDGNKFMRSQNITIPEVEARTITPQILESNIANDMQEITRIEQLAKFAADRAEHYLQLRGQGTDAEKKRAMEEKIKSADEARGAVVTANRILKNLNAQIKVINSRQATTEKYPKLVLPVDLIDIYARFRK